jgi:hypothetical protein
MEIVGYCTIHRDADCKFAMGKPEDWQNKDVRVMEFARDGGALVVSQNGQMMATFDKKDIYRSFRCSEFGEILTPPDLDFVQKAAYSVRATARKGGYAPILRQMIIQASLMKGTYYDHFLWAKQ